jgi:hypothetical protein
VLLRIPQFELTLLNELLRQPDNRVDRGHALMRQRIRQQLLVVDP